MFFKFFITFMAVLSFLCAKPNQNRCTLNSDLKNDRVHIKADTLEFDQIQSIYTAKGHVKLVQFKKDSVYEVYCDKAIYNKIKNTVTAIGHVFSKDNEGNVSYSDLLELEDGFKNGFIESAHIITKKEERLLGVRGIRENNKYTHFYTASYTPCKVCGKEDAPWQINAKEVIHDDKEKTITYYHMTFSVAGIPLFYSPYFSHADPSIKRKSGLLTPGFGYDENSGINISPSFFYVIDKYSDLTLNTILMKNERPIAFGQYRKNLYNGAVKVDLSFQSNKEKSNTIPKNRWHSFITLARDIDEAQRITLKINRASDTTYLLKYPKITSGADGEQLELESHLVYENFKPKTFYNLKGSVYQTANAKTTPVVIPAFFFERFSERPFLTGDWSFTTSVDHLTRTLGVPNLYAKKTTRLFMNYGWEKHYQLNNNLFKFSLQSSIRGYYLNSYKKQYKNGQKETIKPDNDDLKNHQTNNKLLRGSFLPMGIVEWSYPFIQRNKTWHYTVEPKVMFITSPYINQNSLPNNDSIAFTLDDTSIFSPNRFNGQDRFDSGTRLVYGVYQKLYFSSSTYLSWFIGHTKRLDKKQVLESPEMGENKSYSDITNTIKFIPINNLKFRYRNSIDYKTKKQRFFEIGIAAGKPIFSLNIGYIRLAHHTFEKERINQLNWMVTSAIDDNWSLSYGEMKGAAKSKPSLLKRYAGIVWKNDCMTVSTMFFNTNLKNNDVKPNKGFYITFEFKQLGSYTLFQSDEMYIDTGLSNF